MNKKFEKKVKWWGVALLVALPIITMLVCLAIGRMNISIGEIISALSGKNIGSVKSNVILSQRLPRILTAALVGAGLSVSGCLFQSMFSNPLATPDTLGVASGSSFGAVLGILIGVNLVGIQLLSLAFGICAVALTSVTSGERYKNRTSMVLSGIMIGSLFSALTSLVKYVADTESQLPSITYWLMGSLNSAGYKTLVCTSPVIVIALLAVTIIRRKLNLLPISDDEAVSLGVNIKLMRGVTVICAAAMTSSAVSMCGQVGWVGLLIPHICRMIFGNDHKYLIPASMSVGITFMVAVDTLARSVTASEIPVSILTSIIGAPFFIFLLRKSGGWKL